MLNTVNICVYKLQTEKQTRLFFVKFRIFPLKVKGMRYL